MYEPLERLTIKVRLLEIQPSGEPSQQLQCRVFTASLCHKPVNEVSDPSSCPSCTGTDRPGFIVLLGSGTRPMAIVVNGNERSISTNLFIALERLRDEHTTRVLWIDSICIGQSNNAEKAHQVSPKRDIYRRACQVVVWLGAHSLYEGTWELIETLPPAERSPVNKVYKGELSGIARVPTREQDNHALPTYLSCH